MIHLSHLLIDLGSNPDRPRPGRLWLRNIYHVHQRLSMAFPKPAQVTDDPYFITPFDPDRFDHSRFLFRVDYGVFQSSTRAVILVQSTRPPDWEYAFQNARMFLAAPPQVRDFTDRYGIGSTLRFRLRANPTVKRDGKRLGLLKPEDHQRWLERKAEASGFQIESVAISPPGRIYGRKGFQKDAREITMLSVQYHGKLNVLEPSLFEAALKTGLGSAKGFGFGMLSVAPIS